MTRAVFDCMVFLQAATNDAGPAFACLELVEANVVELYVTPAILAEVRDVLSRSKILAKFPHLTPERTALFLQRIATFATLIGEIPNSGLTIRDPDDLHYLDLAIAAKADYLVSRDNDLLCLMDDVKFGAMHPQLKVVDPVTFLAAIRVQ